MTQSVFASCKVFCNPTSSCSVTWRLPALAPACLRAGKRTGTKEPPRGRLPHVPALPALVLGLRETVNFTCGFSCFFFFSSLAVINLCSGLQSCSMQQALLFGFLDEGAVVQRGPRAGPGHPVAASHPHTGPTHNWDTGVGKAGHVLLPQRLRETRHVVGCGLDHPK